MDCPDVPPRSSTLGEHPSGASDPHEAICGICSQRVAQFEPYGVPPRIGCCPHCGAKPRSRALHRLMRDRIGPRLEAGDRVFWRSVHLASAPITSSVAICSRPRAASRWMCGGGAITGASAPGVDSWRRTRRCSRSRTRPSTSSSATTPCRTCARTAPRAGRDRTLPQARRTRDDRHPPRPRRHPGPRTCTGASNPDSARTGSPPTATPGSTGTISSTGRGRRGSSQWRSRCFRAPQPTSLPPPD